MITLVEGNKAPMFLGKNQNNEAISLKDFKGKKVILYFYPHDDTPTCTTQACNLKDNYKTLLQKGFSIIGISSDDVNTHKKFETKHSLPFPLIADVDNKIALKYGVWDWKQFMGKTFVGMHRTTFLINEKGIITHIISKPKSKVHAQEILALFE
jgi:thioredoxin-dependent peroxiredoxin